MTLLPDLQTRLDEAARRHDVPGAVVAVGYESELAEAATGVVNRHTGVATTPESVFQFGSATKVWPTALFMQLVDECLGELDQPARRSLPGFAVVDPEATETVTVRQLLSHTGGFDGDLFEDTGRGDDALDRFLAYLPGNASQVHPPGAMFSYCNAGFCVLGALVSRLRGGTWESVLRERLIEPLGAQHMALLAEEAILFRAAAGHIKQAGSDEYTVFPRWQMPRSNAPAGVRLLSGDAIAAMRSPQVALPGVPLRGAGHWGLGFMLFDWDGTPAIGHDGGTLGQSAMWRVMPDRQLVVAATANGGAAPAFFDDLLDPIVGELTGVTVPLRPVPPSEPARSAVPIPQAYAGRYAYPMVTYDVALADGGVDITATPQGLAAQAGMPTKTDRYVPLAGGTFIAAEPEDGRHATVTFVDGGRYLYDGRAASRVTD